MDISSVYKKKIYAFIGKFIFQFLCLPKAMTAASLKRQFWYRYQHCTLSISALYIKKHSTPLLPELFFNFSAYRRPWRLHLWSASSGCRCSPWRTAARSRQRRPRSTWPSAWDRRRPPCTGSTRRRRQPPPAKHGSRGTKFAIRQDEPRKVKEMHGLYLYRHGTKFSIRQDEPRKVKEMHGLYLYRHGTKFAIWQDDPRKVKEMHRLYLYTDMVRN